MGSSVLWTTDALLETLLVFLAYRVINDALILLMLFQLSILHAILASSHHFRSSSYFFLHLIHQLEIHYRLVILKILFFRIAINHSNH